MTDKKSLIYYPNFATLNHEVLTLFQNMAVFESFQVNAEKFSRDSFVLLSTVRAVNTNESSTDVTLSSTLETLWLLCV